MVGDSHSPILVDPSSSANILHTLIGHTDDVFATAWSPCGRLLATGSQDGSARLWDIRQLHQSLGAVHGRCSAIRSLRFTHQSSLLAIAEETDFVHLVDVDALSAVGGSCPLDLRLDTLPSQTIDFFGEIAGIAFSPQDDAFLFIGTASTDSHLGSILEFTSAIDMDALIDD